MGVSAVVPAALAVIGKRASARHGTNRFRRHNRICKLRCLASRVGVAGLGNESVSQVRTGDLAPVVTTRCRGRETTGACSAGGYDKFTVFCSITPESCGVNAWNRDASRECAPGTWPGRGVSLIGYGMRMRAARRRSPREGERPIRSHMVTVTGDSSVMPTTVPAGSTTSLPVFLAAAVPAAAPMIAPTTLPWALSIW